MFYDYIRHYYRAPHSTPTRKETKIGAFSFQANSSCFYTGLSVPGSNDSAEARCDGEGGVCYSSWLSMYLPYIQSAVRLWKLHTGYHRVYIHDISSIVSLNLERYHLYM